MYRHRLSASLASITIYLTAPILAINWSTRTQTNCASTMSPFLAVCQGTANVIGGTDDHSTATLILKPRVDKLAGERLA